MLGGQEQKRDHQPRHGPLSPASLPQPVPLGHGLRAGKPTSERWDSACLLTAWSLEPHSLQGTSCRGCRGAWAKPCPPLWSRTGSRSSVRRARAGRVARADLRGRKKQCVGTSWHGQAFTTALSGRSLPLGYQEVSRESLQRFSKDGLWGELLCPRARRAGRARHAGPQRSPPGVALPGLVGAHLARAPC